MKIIEKERKKNEYNIQQINKHLVNILEENYYIELGNVDIKVLDKLFKGQPIALKDIYYEDITVNGIGKITNDAKNDINYQLNYLYSLHQKSSSSKFILTCGTIRYLDITEVEKFAPIILIPLTIDYIKKEIFISGQARFNTMFLRVCKNDELLDEKTINEINSLSKTKVDNVLELDTLCTKLHDITNFSVDTVNYLSLMEVEYVDYLEEENFFNVQRSIYEINDIDLMKNYFKNVHPIKPANIEQKYIILKAHNNENIVVDGKLGSGKTSTALNIIGDKIYDGKKILYVNQDLDNISDIRRYMKYLGFDPYTYDLTKNVWPLDDMDKIEVLPIEAFNHKVIDDVASYRNTYHKKYHGYPYSYILEKIATRKALGLEDKIYLEKNLDREEVEYIYKSLKDIEKCLSKVDPLPNNVWARLQSGKNALTTNDIKEHTITFYEQNKKLYKYLDKITSKHNLNKVENITSFVHLTEEINSFKSHKPLPIWGSLEFVDKNHEALSKIAHYVDYYSNSESYYDEHCIYEYEPGTIEEDFKTIINKRYNVINHQSEDVYYVDKLLSNYDLVESILTSSKKWVKGSINIYDKIKNYFDFETPSAEQFILLNKLLNLFETAYIEDKWLEQFVLNPKSLRDKAQKLNKINVQIVEQYQNLDKYLNMEELNYSELTELINDPLYAKRVKVLLNKHVLKENKTTANVISTNLKLYFEKLTELKNELPNDINKDDEHIWGNYITFIDFIDSLTPWETIVLTLFIKKTKEIKGFNRDDLIKDLSILSENQKELEKIESALKTFNLNIVSTNFMESVKSIKSYIPYLEKVLKAIDNINSYFKYNNIKTYDVLYLIEIDKQYLESIKHFKENGDYYKELYGDSYKGCETDTILLGQSIDHFRNFILRIKKYDGIKTETIYTALLNDQIYNEFMEACSNFDKRYEAWYNALRGFSICFYQGKLNLQNNSFLEINKILEEYVDKLDQLESIYKVEFILDTYHYYGLKDFANNIQNGLFNNEIEYLSELYLYSTMCKYHRDMILEGYKEFSIANLNKTVNSFEREEQRICETNIYDLRKRISAHSNKTPKSYRITSIGDSFNSVIESAPHYKKIFIADVDIFNRMNDFSFFDLVIIDDAHLSTSNKYSNLYKANQVVIFGDSSFQSSATNSLMQRNKNFTCIPLHKRYIEMKSEFGNLWASDNQYIYTPSLKIEKHQLTNISGMADMVIEKYKEYYEKNTKVQINILVSKTSTRREIYSILVDKLLNEFSMEAALRILNLSIRIISTGFESSRLADYTYLWYEDLEDFDSLSLDLVKRNYLIAKRAVYLCYEGLRITTENKILMEQIDNFIGEPMKLDFRIDGITKMIYEHMKKNDIDVEVGPGFIDLVVKKNNRNIGFIIYGQRTDMSYSIVDDYIYYVNEYKKRGWDIYIYCMEQLNKNYEDVVNNICKISKEGNNNAK